MNEISQGRKPLDQYKAVFFDVGDTLITIPESRIIMQQVLAARSLHRGEEQVGSLFTEAFRLFYYGKQLDPFEACTPESDRAFWMKLYRYILDKLGANEEDWSRTKYTRAVTNCMMCSRVPSITSYSMMWRNACRSCRNGGCG
ncbi:hypothetical protein ACHHV8_04495 [Paenibacillus sp. TAB 01]|uniref:hypothetical protein n=1 Tax=Paenibacillus sp. TAB 01 TaxID=3368988 RepID=UPI0037509192